MTLPVVLAIAGCVSLLVGIFGGGVKAKELEVPKISAATRVISSLIGISLIGIATWISYANPLQSSGVKPEPTTLIVPTSTYIPPTQIPPTEILSSPTNTILATKESTNWAFALEYRFSAGFWSVGTHSYSFAFSCPNEAPDSVTRDFVVSNSFPLITGDVYLRWSALRIGNPWGDVVDGINPSQSTVASVAWDSITKSEADWRTSSCTGTISWDGGAKEPLKGMSFQH